MVKFSYHTTYLVLDDMLHEQKTKCEWDFCAKLSHSIVSLYFEDEQLDVALNIHNGHNRDDGESSDRVLNNAKVISFYDDKDDKNVAHFYRELFILTIFNGHYIPWIRDSNYHNDYIERVAIILNRLQDVYPLHLQDSQMLRWLDGCVENRMKLSRWLLFNSIINSFRLERELQMTINNIDINVPDADQFACSKRFLIYADYDREDNIQDKDNDNDDRAARDERLGYYLGYLDFVENSTCRLRIPARANHSKREMFINLALVNRDANNQQLLTMKLSETLVSGYSGWSQKFLFEEQQQTESEYRAITEFTLSAQWSLWPQSIDEKLVDNSLALSLADFLSSTFLLLNGQYVWKFFRPFFLHRFARSVQQECDMDAVRQTIAALLMVIDEPDDQVSLFNVVYGQMGGKLSLDQLTTLDCLSFVAVFSRLPHPDNQLQYLKLFEPFIHSNAIRMIVDDDFQILYRLLALLSNQSGQYETQQLQEIVVPFLIGLLRSLTSASLTVTMNEGKTRRYTRILHRVMHKTISMIIQCIDYMKPYNWPLLSIFDEPMSPIRSVIEQMIDNFLHSPSPSMDDHNISQTFRLLFVIYVRLTKNNILDREKHLLPLLTAERLHLYHYYSSESQ